MIALRSRLRVSELRSAVAREIAALKELAPSSEQRQAIPWLEIAGLSLEGAEGVLRKAERELAALDDETPEDDWDDWEEPARPPGCEWCGGRGCDICCAPGYAGVERDP